MSKISRRIKKKPILVFITVFSILFLISTICLIYSILKFSNIENMIRYLASIILGLLSIFCLLQTYKLIYKGKTFGILLYGIILVSLFILESYACGIASGLYSSISNFYKNSYTYSTSLITLKESNINDVKDLKKVKIGMINDSSSIDGYEIAIDIIEENKLKNNNEVVEYDSIGEVIKDLYDKKIDASLVTSTYPSMFQSNPEYANINNETKVILSKSKTVNKKNDTTIKDKNEPFSILILGIDSIESNIRKVTAFNADSLMLVTFNPNTYNTTIVSIPRDTYTPISCLKSKAKSKITHSGWYGASCVVETVEELMDIKIDYYIKINFKGVVNLVNAVDGIEIDVPYSFCEQNSERLWGEKTIYVEKGIQTLNGEQALAFARNRHPNPTYCSSKWTNYNSDDIVRGQNQQLLINSLINKIATTANLNKIYSILDILGDNMDTNMNTEDILSYYNLVKDIALNGLSNKNIISFDRLYLSTYGKYIYDALMNASLSNQVYYIDSLNAIKKEMKINLGLEKANLIKSFTFSANKPYVEPKIGKGTYTQSDIITVPSFKGKDKVEAITWAKNNNIDVVIEYEDVIEGINDTVIKQSIPASYIVSNIKAGTKLTITLAKVSDVKDTNDNSIENKDTNE